MSTEEVELPNSSEFIPLPNLRNSPLGRSTEGLAFFHFNIHPNIIRINPRMINTPYFLRKYPQCNRYLTKWACSENDWNRLRLEEQREFLMLCLDYAISFEAKKGLKPYSLVGYYEYSADKNLHLHATLAVDPGQQYLGWVREICRTVNSLISSNRRPIPTKFKDDVRYAGCAGGIVRNLEARRQYEIKQQKDMDYEPFFIDYQIPEELRVFCANSEDKKALDLPKMIYKFDLKKLFSEQ